jgi:quercetin dioxygenase-like cupin family protein
MSRVAGLLRPDSPTRGPPFVPSSTMRVDDLAKALRVNRVCETINPVASARNSLRVLIITKELKMKRIHVLLVVLFVTGLVRGDASVTREQDPLTVNPKTIALKLENARVRVLEATLKPGDKEKPHSHPAYVIYVIAGGKFRNHAADGTVTDGEFKTGDVIYRDPISQHWAENTGDTTIRLELVELKN